MTGIYRVWCLRASVRNISTCCSANKRKVLIAVELRIHFSRYTFTCGEVESRPASERTECTGLHSTYPCLHNLSATDRSSNKAQLLSAAAKMCERVAYRVPHRRIGKSERCSLNRPHVPGMHLQMCMNVSFALCGDTRKIFLFNIYPFQFTMMSGFHFLPTNWNSWFHD